MLRRLALLASLLGVTAYTAPSWKHASALVSDEDFDASTCVGISGTNKDTEWCVASCGAIVKPDCPSSFCACEGEVPNDSSLTDAATIRDAEVAKRDADIADRNAGGAVDAEVAERDANVASRDAGAAGDADATSDAGTGFDASTCKGVSGTEKDAAWCVASCGAPIKPDCPTTFCTCDGEVGHDSSVRAGTTGDGEMTDAATATADAIANRDAEIAKRAAAGNHDTAESAALADPTFDGSSCHRVQEHREDQPGNNEDDDKWCKDHCGLVPTECPALFCKCDPPTYDLPPNMQDTEGAPISEGAPIFGAHVKGGVAPP